MTTSRISLRTVATLAVGLLLGTSGSVAQTSGGGASELVTWTCTGNPCSAGPSVSNHALVWPASSEPLKVRLNYTASAGVYLPSQVANGATVSITSGSATLFAGLPSASSHRTLGTLGVGNSLQVSGLGSSEVLSVQSLSGFAYQIVLPQPPVPEAPVPGTLSQRITGVCTGSPCPWGSSISAHAITWPDAAEPLTTRLGYTFSAGVYLPSWMSNGATITVTAGSATLFAGLPSSSTHRTVATVANGSSYLVTGLASGEVLSAQSQYGFTYQIDLPPPPPPPPQGTGSSELVTWTCLRTPCPSGGSLSGQAIAWPASTNPLSQRYNYITSAGVYLPSATGNGTVVAINSGTATLYAGLPDASAHRTLATIGVGQSYVVSGLGMGEVLSVLSSQRFNYQVQLPDLPPSDPGEIVESVAAYWRCDTPGCTSPDWVGAVVTWPEWAAYSNNARSGEQSRTVYSASGGLLYPYMGSWADGCEVTGESGAVVVIEWQRGTDIWRQTWLGPRDTYIIDLMSPEDGAMIESWPGSSVSLKNCEPHPLP